MTVLDPQNPSVQDPADLSAIDMIRIILRHRKLILATIVIGTLTTGLVGILTPNHFTAKATILPIEKQNNANFSALLSSMGGGLGALASQAGISSQGISDRLITIVQSRTITEKVINQNNLLPILFESRWDKKNKQWKRGFFGQGSAEPPLLDDALAKMTESLKVGKAKKGDAISIAFESNDPKLSATIVNSYLAQLDTYLKNNVLTTAKKNRILTEEQLGITRVKLDNLERQMMNFQKNNKVVSLSGQAEASVQAHADLKSKLIASEIELNILKKSTIDGDPRTFMKNAEVTELRSQIKRLEENTNPDPAISFRNAPSLGYQFVKLKRELLIQEKLFELLTQQHEIAKIEESRDDMSFQILDPASPPEKKSGPKRAFSLLIALVISTLFGTILAFCVDYWQKHRNSLSMTQE